jgi:ACR3 family arsenite efflux pump ArsB
MANLPKVLIGLAALAFVLAVIVSLTGEPIMRTRAEAFSRASNNLALIAIALLLLGRNRGSGLG